jgi:hypothetical protein
MFTVYVLYNHTHDGRDFIGVYGSLDQAEKEKARYLEKDEDGYCYYSEYDMQIDPYDVVVD